MYPAVWMHFSGMAGFDERLRTVVTVGVGSLRRITPKSGEGRMRARTPGPLIRGGPVNSSVETANSVERGVPPHPIATYRVL